MNQLGVIFYTMILRNYRFTSTPHNLSQNKGVNRKISMGGGGLTEKIPKNSTIKHLSVWGATVKRPKNSKKH